MPSELQIKRSIEANTKHGHGGPKRSKEYRAWAHILGRCLNPKDNSYPLYGGRGINVDPSWVKSFEAFLNSVGKAPSPMHSLDRINNNGNYEPGNVRWATRYEQSRNTRRNIVVDGMCLKDICSLKSISYEAAQARIRRGQKAKQAIIELEALK